VANAWERGRKDVRHAEAVSEDFEFPGSDKCGQRNASARTGSGHRANCYAFLKPLTVPLIPPPFQLPSSLSPSIFRVTW
jgi:hypothetical protein